MKDPRAFFFYIVATLCFWDFGAVLGRLVVRQNIPQNPLLSIVQAKNTGAAFSILQEHTWLLGAFGIVTLFVVCYLVFRHCSFNDKFYLLSSVLFSAGILGNTAERLFRGYVVDYIKLNFVDFPVFNFFDVMICTAVALFAVFAINEEFVKKVKFRK